MKNIVVTEQNAHEDNVHRWCAEASTLGLAPGEWPVQLPTTLGNGQPFLRGLMLRDSVGYAQANGCLHLTVFND